MSSDNQVQLKHSSISYVPFSVYEKDFTFYVNNEEIKTSRIVSDLISPTISQIHLIDPTINTFSIKTKTTGDFTHILNLINFEIFNIPENEINFFIEVFEQLGTESIKYTASTKEIDITIDNVIKLIQTHEKHDTFYNDQITKEINFLSKHFYELYEDHEHEFQNFKSKTIERIINNENLLIKEEDQLFDYINKLYKQNDKYCSYYEYIQFSNVSKSKICEFIEIFDISDLTNSTWRSISERLRCEINEKNKKEDEKRYAEKKTTSILFQKTDNKDFKEI